jgi:hypothetical protein
MIYRLNDAEKSVLLKTLLYDKYKSEFIHIDGEMKHVGNLSFENFIYDLLHKEDY